MSTPWTGGSPSGAAADPWPLFVVHTDRPSINRRYRRIVGSFSAVTLAVVALAVTAAWLFGQTEANPLYLLPLLVVPAATVFQVAYSCYVWGSRMSLPEPLVLEPAGVTVTMAQGRLRLPWAAVTGITVRPLMGSSILRFQLDPAVSATSPGVETDLAPRFLARLVRSGVLLGSAGVHEDLEQVAAVASQLAGRPLRTP